MMDFSKKVKNVYKCIECESEFSVNMPAMFSRVILERCDPCQERYLEKCKQAELKKYLSGAIERSGIPEKYRTYNPQVAADLGTSWLYGWVTERANASIWLGGTNGIGKTHTSHYVALERITKHGETVQAIRCSQFLLELVQLRMGNKEDIRQGRKTLDRAINIDLLLLDDLGKEKLSPTKAEILWELIDLRERNDKRIWITTNISGTKLLDRLGDDYGPAVLKRLRRMIPDGNIIKGDEPE